MLFDLISRLASNDTIDSVLRHRELSGTKDLSAPMYQWQIPGVQLKSGPLTKP